VLAAAGLRRLGLAHEIAEVFSPERMCPAAGQGALAIQTRESDPAREICAEFNDEPTSQAVTCERTVLAALGGGCQLPVGAFAETIEETLKVIAVVVSPDGTRCLRAHAAGSRHRPEELGQTVATDLLSRGADNILSESK
jgi:hydroxymethylbilane synthase